MDPAGDLFMERLVGVTALLEIDFEDRFKIFRLFSLLPLLLLLPFAKNFELLIMGYLFKFKILLFYYC